MDLVDQAIDNGLVLKGTQLSMDNYFGGVELCDELWNKGITMIATMRQNRVGIPEEMKTVVNREVNSTITLWNSDEKKKNFTLTSYTVKTSSKKKNVIVLSSYAIIPGTLKVGNDSSRRPQVISLYNFTKGGTDIFDQRIRKKSTLFKTNRWPMAAFCFLLDSILINSTTVCCLNSGLEPRKTNYEVKAWELIHALVKPFIQSRSTTFVQSHIKLKIALYLKQKVRVIDNEENEQQDQLLPIQADTAKRCNQCIDKAKLQGRHPGNVTKTKNRCQQCGHPVCLNHGHALLKCKICVSNRNEDDTNDG